MSTYIISHNLNDLVGAIIMAYHKFDDQIGAIERVDIYRQPMVTQHYAKKAKLSYQYEDILRKKLKRPCRVHM